MRFVSIIIPYTQKKSKRRHKILSAFFCRKETQAQAEGTIHMPAIYEGMNAAAVTLVSLSIILFAGFLVTRVTKLLRLPNVSGFIIAGLLIGPGALGLIPQSTVDGMSFVSDIALTFIAFNVGSYFKREVIRSTGPRILIVTLFEALLSGVVVFLAMRLLFGLSADFSLLIAAIATATAPASTMMTVRQYNAKGPFVDALMQVVALDDVVCLFVYCVAAAVVGAEDGPGVWEIVLPVVWNIVALSVGAGCGFLLSKLLKPSRSSDNRLILAVAMLLGISGLCALVDISPLLACMLFSAVYINRTDDRELFAQLNGFTPPIMSIFFVLSGMNLDLHALAGAGVVGAVYCIVRIAGKYLGAFAGCARHADARQNARLAGRDAHPAGGRGHRAGLSRLPSAAGGDRRDAADDHPLFLGPLRADRTGVREGGAVPLGRHRQGGAAAAAGASAPAAGETQKSRKRLDKTALEMI